MSTLRIHVPHLPRAWPLPALARVAAVVGTVLDTYSEALRQTHEVQKNFSFADS